VVEINPVKNDQKIKVRSSSVELPARGTAIEDYALKVNFGGSCSTVMICKKK